ncbi:MAG: flagellar basal body rod protein FlgB [Solirubrobacterales bacterium]
MSVFDPTQLILVRAISGATLRNTVLANNVANADTPGFQPGDVDFHAALRGAIGAGSEAIEAAQISPEQGPPIALRSDGNGVDAEAESAKLAENGLELGALVQFAGARVQIMRTAMGVS